ncbi:MAG: kynureninase [Candidatus Neomarinimicrobiota bacterium]
MKYKNTEVFAQNLDETDKLAKHRNDFFYPKDNKKNELIYFAGNSLGLQPKRVSDYLTKELSVWSEKGVLGQEERWIEYHEKFTESTAKLVGALSSEVVVMNALTVNIHLLLISFYQPKEAKYKVIIEKDAFPSDYYAVKSQIKLHGFDPKQALIELTPREGEKILRHEDIIATIESHRDEIALIYLGGVNYYTGQSFNLKEITKVGRENGSIVGFNLAHSAGNLLLHLHDWDVDFSAWCTYKYLCGGPGSPSGVFIHERHHKWNGPRLLGWWGHNKDSRFEMSSTFDPINTAEGWQISNAPIMGMAPLVAAMNIYGKAGMNSIRDKGKNISSYMEYLIHQLIPSIYIVTPHDRGCQLSLVVPKGKKVYDYLLEKSVICDWRNPDVIRVAPHPLYNSYIEVFNFVKILKHAIEN